jgi:hypothetical protein
MRQQREVLEHHAHLVASDLDHLALREAEKQVLAVEDDLARVGSTSRDMQRTSVDLPEPDSPMMTKHSPSITSRLASRTAGTNPAACSRSRLGAVPRPASAPGDFAPKIFQTLRQASLTFGINRDRKGGKLERRTGGAPQHTAGRS